MRDAPSPELIELLATLSLTTDRQLAAAGRHARRLAGSLPVFDSVWLDALVRAGRVTPFQAAEIQAGRGAALACGPYVAARRRPTLGYAEVFEAEPVLLTVAPIEPDQRDAATERLSAIVMQTAMQTSGCFPSLIAHGIDGSRLWTAWERPGGISAAEWMNENGRLPPLVVLEIARRMLVGLCELERHGEVHGDLHARSLFIDRRGEIAMAFTGLRGAVRPRESLNSFDLPPHCYETLSPERVLASAPPHLGSELFACGCLWWHLLTGRPPIAGGNSAAKLRAAATGRISDVRKVAPDTPEVLADLIAACTAANPTDRPRSFAEMARILGPPAEHGNRPIARAMRRAERWVLPRPSHKCIRSRLQQPLAEVGAVAACLLLVVVAWRLMVPARGAHTPPLAARQVQPLTPVPISPPAPVEHPVERVTYEQPADKQASPAATEPLRLPEGRTLRLASLSPVAGQRICGQHDGRVVVSLPADGLTIDVDDVHFENIDFLAADGAETMLELRAPTATFSGCRFLGTEAAERLPVAIRWRSPTADDWLPTDERLTLTSCAFHRVDAAIDCDHNHTASLELSNVLQTRSGCLLRCAPEETAKPLNVELDRCTLRETGAVVRILELAAIDARMHRIRVVAADSVFQLRSGRALLELPVDFEESRLAELKWQGTGSLCAIETPLAAVIEKEGTVAEAVDDAHLDVSGLARSTLEFAGETSDEAAASELRRWVAARRSKVPPGIITGGK